MSFALLDFSGNEVEVLRINDTRIRHNEVKSSIEEHHRNPSKYVSEERNMYKFVKHCRKQLNQSLLKEEGVDHLRCYWI